MEVLTCKTCGSSLKIQPNKSTCICEYCGNTQTITTATDDKLKSLFNRANSFRLKNEFDKAQEIYEQLINDNTRDPEAYWGNVLCKYGIEYVDDVDGKKVPTCHRTEFDSIFDDVDYQAVLEKADAEQKEIYQAEAEKIDRIQKRILSIVNNEEAYDIFISYKESDENGNRTEDSRIASEVYNFLTNKGFKVFCSQITLDEKGVGEYEPYIFASLHSSKVMLLIGTKIEHINATWVHNEWSRYLKLMKKDKNKRLFVCFKDLNAGELPKEIGTLNAYDISKMGFLTDLERNVRKIVIGDASVGSASSKNNDKIANYLRRVEQFLEDEDWESADSYCEQVLDIDANNGEAYFFKLLISLNVCTEDKLKDYPNPFDDNPAYKKVIRYSSDARKKTVEKANEDIKARLEFESQKKIYDKAFSVMRSADSEHGFLEAASLFKSVADTFEKAEMLEKECVEKAEDSRKLAVYNSALRYHQVHEIASQEKAIRKFYSIKDYSDSEKYIKEAEEEIEIIKKEIHDNKVAKEKKEKEERIAAELAEAKRLADIQKAKRNKFLSKAIPIVLVILLFGFSVLYFKVINPSNHYKSATEALAQKKYSVAYDEYNKANNYKDAKDNAQKLANEHMEVCHIGDTVFFGKFEQDANKKNGKEDIEWIVISKEKGKVLLMSKYALTTRAYNSKKADMTWEKCSLRKWLNGDFYKKSFSESERKKIKKTEVETPKNSVYKTSGGKKTSDKIYILSTSTANKYLSFSMKKCKLTPAAMAEEKRTESEIGWWLRTPGDKKNKASIVDTYGKIEDIGQAVQKQTGVRPVMWISTK